MSTNTPIPTSAPIYFDSKPSLVGETVTELLTEKGFPFIRSTNTFTLPDEGLTIKIEGTRQGTAIYFSPTNSDTAPLIDRLHKQLSKILIDVTPKASYKKKKNRVVVGCGTAVILCIAIFTLVGVQLYRLNQPPPLLWRYNAYGSISARPVIANDTVFFGTLGNHDSYFFAINLADGTERWKVSYGQTNIFYWAETLTSNNLVLFGTDEGYFYALDTLTGTEAWRFSPEQRGIDPADCGRCALKFRIPVIANDIVYLPSHDHHLYALDATTGQELWRFNGGGSFLDTPAVVGNAVYAGNIDGQIYILDAQTGAVQNQIKVGQSVYETLPDGNLIYAMLEGGTLQAFDLNNGNPVWQYNDDSERMLGGFSGYMQVHGDKLFAMSSRRVYAFAKETGELAWNYVEMQSSVYSDFTVENGRFYVGDNESYLYVLDANSGKQLHRLRMTLHDTSSSELTSKPLFTPAIHNGNAYFGWKNHLNAIEIEPSN